MSESRIDVVIAEYLAACDAGRNPDRAAFLAKHPDLASELTAFLDDHERMRAAADPEATLAPPSAAPTTLHYVGDYELLEEIARGGMGVVYRARQVTANRIVAVKMILAGSFTDEAGIQRFRIEAEAAANLDHPNILPIYEVSEHEGRPYFSMKLAEGSLAGRKLSPRESASLVAKLARAVHFAHQRGILHRDLKLANVLLDATGEPLIADFGLAKRVEGDAGMTVTGAIVGTPSYMPPEQARGERVTTSADVYSLGAILYECLTGQPPFREASVMETLLAVINNEPAPIPNGDRDLAIIAHKCLRKEARERYTSAADLADDLERWARGEPIQARPVGTIERAVKWVRRNPAVAALIASVLLLFTAGIVASWLLTTWALREKSHAEGQADEARKQTRRAGELLVQSELSNYAGRLLLAKSAFGDLRARDGFDALDGCQWNLRGWEHRHLHARFSSRLTLTGHRSDVSAVAWSPDGRRFALVCGNPIPFGVDYQGEVSVWDAEKNTRNWAISFGEVGVWGVAWSPDGKRLLVGCQDHTARVLAIDTGKELLQLKGHDKPVFGVAWSPDGKHLLTGSGDKTARLWDAVKGTQSHVLPGHAENILSVAFSPDGKHCVTGDINGPARIWDAEQGRLVRTLAGKPVGVQHVAWSPDGKFLATGHYENVAKVWNPATGAERVVLRGHRDRLTGVAFSPDGQRLLTASADGTVRVWEADSGEALFGLQGDLWSVAAAAFSPDGRRILAGCDATAQLWDADRGQEILTLSSGEVPLAALAVAFNPEGTRLLAAYYPNSARVWDVQTGQVLLTLMGHEKPVMEVAWSPDGQRLLTGSDDHTACVWDADTGAKLLTLKGHTGRIRQALWSPDGKHIVTSSLDETVRRWDAARGTEIEKRHSPYPLRISKLVYHPDGRTVFMSREDDTIQAWDTATGEQRLVLRGPRGVGHGLAIDPAGKRLLTGSYDDTARVWDIASGRALLTLKGHSAWVGVVAWSPDGRRLLTADDGQIKFWDADRGLELFTLREPPHGSIHALAWSRDGRRLASGGFSTVRIWFAGSDPAPLVLRTRQHPIACLAWHADGKLLLTGSKNGVARLWDTEKGQELHALEGHAEAVERVAFSRDGRRAFAWDAKGEVRAWSVDDGTDADAANPPEPSSTVRALSPDGSRTATAQESNVVLTDARPAVNANAWPPPDVADRQRYHVEQATLAEKAGHWFAVAFHLGYLLLDDPDNAEFQQRQKDALQKHRMN